MFSMVVVGLLVAVPVASSTASEPEVPGDALVLSPTPIVQVPVKLPSPVPSVPPPGFGTALGITGIAAGVLVTTVRKKRDDEPIYVVVHGSGGSPDDFDTLLDKLDVPDDRVVEFDYGEVSGGDSSTAASRVVSTEEAAEALDDLIRDLSKDHSNIYSLHHSRGGAVGVTMISSLDDGTMPPIDGYVGAALLDPAIGDSWLGFLQRVGAVSPLLPDNGGFTVERCIDGVCRDVRENLGAASGVEVIAIRNPDAEITNFRDNPVGLRVLDLINDGGVPAPLLLPFSPLLTFHRIWQAHTSVLKHDAVATCISQEVEEPGTCVWNAG